MTTIVYVTYSYYSNVYHLIGDNYGLNSSGVLLETTFGMIIFILLLIALDRRVNFDLNETKKRDEIVCWFFSMISDRIYEPIGSFMDA